MSCFSNRTDIEEHNTKDSGIPWIGQIPEDWEVKPLKAILAERKENNNPIKTEEILSLTNTRGVILYSEKGDIGNKAKEDLTCYKLAYPNDIVVNSMNVVIGSVGLSNYFGCVSPVYYMLYSRNIDKYNIEFYNYIFQSEVLQKSLKGLGNGILEIRMRISMSKLNIISLPVPSFQTQQAIANYLDLKTSQIDSIISNLTNQNKKLSEYRKSLISEAVTKGLDKTVKMKDSGIPWIGQIPEDWEVKKIKLCIEYHCTGSWGNAPAGNNNDCICIRVADFDYNSLSIKDNEYTIRNYDDSVNIIKLILNKNDLIIEKSGGGKNFPVGRVVIFNKNIKSLCSNFIEKIKVNQNNDNVFINYLFSVLYSIGLNNKSINQTTGIQNLNISEYFNEKCAIPKINIQQSIANYLDLKTSQIDSIIEDQKKLIELLKEYRKSVISEAVTGKVIV
jgi:type I restriction enzyme S subunit